MRGKKGFTLIELLAIIVILAIIAVITVPIILNIIENAKKGTATDSAYGYKDAVDKYYVFELYDSKNLKLNGDYIVEDGKLKGLGFPSEGIVIPADGTIPTSGTLTYENSVFKSGCLVMGDYAVTFNSDGTTSTEKGSCGPDIAAIIEELPGEIFDDGYKYLTTPVTVYYNPANSSDICNSDNSVSTTGTKTGCMKWYAYSVKDNVVNMILDHNINPSGTGVAWVSNSDYSNSGELGVSLGVTNMGNGEYGRNHDKGPLTALNYLKNNTSDWVTTVQGDYSIYTAGLSDAVYSIDYSGYKARLITAQEIANITGASDATNGIGFNETSSYNWFYLDGTGSNWQTNNNVKYKWLYENLSSLTGLYGYWSSSPVADDSRYAWYVFSGGTLYRLSVSSTDLGVRPVITVSSSIVFSN